MKVISQALLMVFVLAAAVGTASAQFTLGSPSDIGSCGPNCIVYQNTASYTAAASTLSQTELDAQEVQLPQFNINGVTLTQAVLDVDGAIEGTITLTNSGSAPANIKGTTSSDMFVFANQAAAQAAFSSLNFGAELGDNTLAFNTGFQSVGAGGNQTFPAIGDFNSNGLLWGETVSGGALSGYEGGGDVDYWVDTNTALTLSGGGGQAGGHQSTLAQTDGSVVYTYDYDVYTPPSGPTPEPVSMVLLGSGLACLGLLKRKRFTR